MTCKHCGGKAAKNRKECYTCKTRRYRENNPIRASFHNHKDNAKRRGYEWGLSFEQFKEFAVETKLIINSGKTAQSYSIDRIDNDKGYIVDNIQVLTISENTKKQHKERKIKFIEGSGLRVVDRFSYIPDEDEPF